MVELAPGSLLDLVPKKIHDNLEFRRTMRLWGGRSADNAKSLAVACSRDLLFFVNTFVWTHDPRLVPLPTEVPFVTYPFQDDALLGIYQAIMDGENLGIEKSRDMGASWMILTVFYWLWLFQRGNTFLVVSRNEDYVDRRGDPKALFYKLDFMHKRLPRYLQPNITRNKLSLTNEDNGSVINGESTTGDVGRGARLTAIMLDEFAAFDVEDGYKALAATMEATECRIFNSTPQGSGNAHYDIIHNPEIRKIRLHWPSHPLKAKGLTYRPDGKPTSPWYERRVKLAGLATIAAQELDIDYLAAGGQVFKPEELQLVRRRDCIAPLEIGDLRLGEEGIAGEFRSNEKGLLRLWRAPDVLGNLPPDREYVVGADISTGTGYSNSVLTIGDKSTREKVGQMDSPTMSPEKLAVYAVALCRWLQTRDGVGAFLIWESNGPGMIFGNKVIELGYRNIFYRSDEKKIGRKQSDVPGWYSNKDSKKTLLAEYGAAIMNGDFVERCEYTVNECGEYVYGKGGVIEHARAMSCMDPSGARENHGDRVISSALCSRAMRNASVEKPVEQEIPVGSFQWRRDEQQRRMNRGTSRWQRSKPALYYASGPDTPVHWEKSELI